MKSIAKTTINDRIRVSSACIAMPSVLDYGVYYQYETWVFVNPPDRSRQIIVGSGYHESSRLEGITARLHNRIVNVLLKQSHEPLPMH